MDSCLFTFVLMVSLTGPNGFLCCPLRYLSPMRPGLRVLPPESSATPGSQASAQPLTQPGGGQTPRLPKSNSLSLFYKKCKVTIDHIVYLGLFKLYNRFLWITCIQ